MKLWDKWFRRNGSSESLPADEVEIGDNLPAHIAVIMDGNGRWAGNKGLPRVAGHRSGMKNVKTIAIAANEIGIRALTLYAFSTENWKRPKDEVDYLMHLPQEFYVQEIEELIKNNIRIRMMGDEQTLPDYTLKPIRNAMERTRNNTGMILNFAMNYGGRKEIVEAANRLVADIRSGKVQEDCIEESRFNEYLQSSGLPDPDLLIRTSGELRLSNFMLWQLAYAELWFTDVYWPDFSREHLYAAIKDYQRRKRRYGGL